MNLRESLLTFAQYHADVLKEKEAKMSEIKRKYAVQLADGGGAGMMDPQ